MYNVMLMLSSTMFPTLKWDLTSNSIIILCPPHQKDHSKFLMHALSFHIPFHFAFQLLH